MGFDHAAIQSCLASVVKLDNGPNPRDDALMMIKPTTAVAVLASVLFVSPGTGETWFWHNEPANITIDIAGIVGDDNHDGLITEDESGWQCATMGNRICGPTITPDGYETDTGAYVGGYN